MPPFSFIVYSTGGGGEGEWSREGRGGGRFEC